MGKQLKVSAVMSVPRLAFSENMFCAVNVLPRLNIQIFKHSSAFWEQSISLLLEARVIAGDDYIMTVDYDTVFTEKNVTDLIAAMEQTGADAIFPMQVKRNCNTLLSSLHGEEMKLENGQLSTDLTKDFTKCLTGHFGLTILRASSLKKLPHPWFCGRPSEKTCRWETDDRTDPDIFFWKVAHVEGWNVLQANKIVVGHLQLMVSWPTVDLSVKHQYVNEWYDKGVPEGVLQ